MPAGGAGPRWTRAALLKLRLRRRYDFPMMLRTAAALLLVPLLQGCASTQAANAAAQKKKEWTEGVVVATNFCDPDGKVRVAHIKDQPQLLDCTLEEILGTHMRKCICHDQTQRQLDHDDSQQFMENAAQAKQVKRGG